jgi:hypothetical protein
VLVIYLAPLRRGFLLLVACKNITVIRFQKSTCCLRLTSALTCECERKYPDLIPRLEAPDTPYYPSGASSFGRLSFCPCCGFLY